jgi:hypothetical protein
MKRKEIQLDIKSYFKDGDCSKKIKSIQTKKKKNKSQEVYIITYKFQVIKQSQDEMFNCNCIQQVFAPQLLSPNTHTTKFSQLKND